MKLATSAKHVTRESQQEASTAKGRMQTWSTGESRPRERFSYWREAICRSVFNISIEAAPEHFSAHLSARNSGPLRLMRSHASGYRIARDRRDVDSAPADHYSVYLQLHGRAIL